MAKAKKAVKRAKKTKRTQKTQKTRKTRKAAALLIKGHVLVRDPEMIEDLDKRGYGEKDADQLLLSPEEAMYLNEKRAEFPIEDYTGKKLTYRQLMGRFTRTDKEFSRKYLVFRDLRNRGYCVKTGFKFGSDYRLYARGDRPGRGHAMWLVHCVPENTTFGFSNLSRSVRLAQNVRKKMIYAVLDKEGDITYYKIDRITP